MLPSHGSANCTDATRKCHRCTQNRVVSRRSVPRHRPRRGRPWKPGRAASRPPGCHTLDLPCDRGRVNTAWDPRRRYEVTVTLSRPADVEALLPPGGQAAVDMAAAAIAADGLLT